MEVLIIVKSEVLCPSFGIPILLNVCRMCKFYRYETVDSKVICSHIPSPKRVK